MMHITNPRARVLLANDQPAWTRDRRIKQSDIDRYGSAEKARKAKEAAKPTGSALPVAALTALGGDHGRG